MPGLSSLAFNLAPNRPFFASPPYKQLGRPEACFFRLRRSDVFEPPIDKGPVLGQTSVGSAPALAVPMTLTDASGPLSAASQAAFFGFEASPHRLRTIAVLNTVLIL
jgi:hypothetical protein